MITQQNACVKRLIALNCKKLAFNNFKFVKYCETFAKEYGSAFKIDPLANKTIKS